MSENRAIQIGYDVHDCDAVYRCLKCKQVFFGSYIYHHNPNENGTRKYCPHCKTELKGLDGLNVS